MYCTVGEVLEMIKDDMKNVIIGDEYIEDEQEREAKIATLCESAISDACAEIDGYLAKRYRVPFTKTPQVINKFAKDISVYNLVSVSYTHLDVYKRQPSGGGSSPWSCKINQLHIQRQSPCHPVRIQALHSHPVRLFRTGGRLS